MDKLLGAIGLCRKAGRLVMGTDPVAEEVAKGRVSLVLTASDFAPRSRKNAEQVCATHGVRLADLPYNMEQLGALMGKIYGVFAVCDPGFARMIIAQLGKTTDETTTT